jgi:hypothetical protein
MQPQVVEGRADQLVVDQSKESPPKRMKSEADFDVALASEALLKMKELVINVRREGSKQKVEGVSAGLTSVNCKGKRVRQIDEDDSEWGWMSSFDWDADLKHFEESRSVQINPIKAILGKVINCPGLQIHFHGNVNLKE